MAAERGHLPVVKVLLAYGADPKVAARNGDTPLSDAVNSGHNDVVSLIQKHLSQRDEAIEKVIDATALKSYWSQLAKQWWNRITAPETTCGKCYCKQIKRSEGYYSDIFSELFCESCCDRRLEYDRLEVIRNDKSPVTKEELRHAREAAGLLDRRDNK
jgi:hypothetical protein